MFDTHIRFAHRPGADEGLVSICTRCFATVGHGRDDQSLARMETEHICDSKVLRRLGVDPA